MLFKKTRHAVTKEVAPKEVLEREKQGTALAGGVVLTDCEALFTRQYKRLYLPYAEIKWAYLQIAQSQVTMGRRGGALNEYRVLYRTAESEGMMILDSEANAKTVLQKIGRMNPDCAIGFTQENKKRFGA